MKKSLLFMTILCSASLMGCSNFAPLNQPPQNVNKNTANHVRKTSNKMNSSANSSDTPAITADDLSNLSLNNNQATSGNLWQKIGEGLKIPNPESHPEVQEQIRWFMSHPGYLQRTTERARPYLFMVYQEVKSRNLPTELVLLPINESAYYPFSYSSTGATGIWQLMPGTASDWGLKKNFWYDGRRDIFDSTNAALDYLTYLAHYFNGDWLLAIAAYDTGEGNVEHAIARNLRDGLPTDFWSLRLSSETRSYVPRLLALAAILEHPDRYPVELPPIDAKPVVAPVHLGHQIKLTDAARLAGISVNQLKVLNPGLSKTATDPGSDAKLLLPINSIDNFKANLNSLPTFETNQQSQTFGRYRVQRGDTLQSIADRFNISVDELRQANNLFGRHVATGKVLFIPNVAENYKPSTQINLDQTQLSLNSTNTNINTLPNLDTTASTSTTPTSNNTNTNDKPTISAKHVVKHKIASGETLASISKRYHVSIKQLQILNPGISSQSLHPGDVIIISASNQAVKNTNHKRKHHH